MSVVSVTDADAPLVWSLSAFDALGVQDLHDLLQLRSEVFVVEQNCLFQDIDGADGQAVHLLGCRGGVLIAYARCFPAGVKFSEASIGRVATRRSARGNGLGHLLMEEAVAAVCSLWGPQPIRIGAQAHLKEFYSSHGFVDVDMPYVEDGIDHLEMVWKPRKTEQIHDH
jgi:ElaA protein